MALLVAAALAVTLSLTPLVAVEPATITARVHISPDQENRGACVAIWLPGDEFPVQESCWSLNGANEAATFTRRFSRLLLGGYVAVLSVQTTRGVIVRKAQFVVG